MTILLDTFLIIITVITRILTHHRYYLSLAGASIMVLIPLSSLILLNWRIHRAIKQQQAFRASLQVKDLDR